jgi:hypothetical protein
MSIGIGGVCVYIRGPCKGHEGEPAAETKARTCNGSRSRQGVLAEQGEAGIRFDSKWVSLTEEGGRGGGCR